MLLISYEQLPERSGISTKQQSKLRKDGRFPILFKNMGRLVYYSIYDVANFLLQQQFPPQELEETHHNKRVNRNEYGDT